MDGWSVSAGSDATKRVRLLCWRLLFAFLAFGSRAVCGPEGLAYKSVMDVVETGLGSGGGQHENEEEEASAAMNGFSFRSTNVEQMWKGVHA